jgi:hypothetical protein
MVEGPTGSRGARREHGGGLRLADRLTFRANLLIGVSILVLATGTSLILIAGGAARATTSALAGDLFRETSGHAATHARGFVGGAVPVIRSMALLGDGALALEDSDRLAAQFVAVLPANPGVSWLSYSDESGSFTGAYRTPSGGLRSTRAVSLTAARASWSTT